jgi:tetratricopeptide (TPR) repeat protein
MSPEQAELSPPGVDTRSDIYSLGVMLYELLAGTTPFDKDRLHLASYDELRRIIREEEPPRPSARITTLAADKASTVHEHRRTDAKRLSQQVGGELDWIVMKCLEKDRNRRYESASSLARDIERYLRDEPVHACPPSASYRFRKFARRNKTLLAAGGAIAAAILIGLVVSIWMYLRERAAVEVARANEVRAKANEARAKTESARAKAVSDLFREIIFSPSRGWRIKGSQYTAREMFDDFAANLGNQLEDQPEVEAQIRFSIGCSYAMLGAPDRAEPYFKRAIELGQTLDSPQMVNLLADSLAIYGKNLFLQGRFDEAESLLREALKSYRQRGIRGTMPITVCRDLPQVLAASGRHDEAARAIDEAWAEMQGYDKLPPEFAQFPSGDVAGTCAGFAYYFATIGREEEAAEFLGRAIRAQERLQNPYDSLAALYNVAIARLRLGDEVGYRAACRVLANPPVRITSKDSFVSDEFHMGRMFVCCLAPDAVDDPRVLVKQAEEFGAHNSMQTPYIDLDLLGATHFRAGHFKEAAQYSEQAIAQSPSDAPPSHGTDHGARLCLAMSKWHLGERDEARRLLREVQPAIDKSLENPSLPWQPRAGIEVFRREAEALIKPKEADEAVDKSPTPPPDP